MLFQKLVNRMCSHCLFPACWQVLNGLLATSYKVVELNRLVTSCSNNLLSSCNSTICQQVVSDNLVATWWNNSIVTTCWETCYKPVANTSCWEVVRFLRVYNIIMITEIISFICRYVWYPALLLAFISCAYNPVIYCFLSKNFRKAFKSILCCVKLPKIWRVSSSGTPMTPQRTVRTNIATDHDVWLYRLQWCDNTTTCVYKLNCVPLPVSASLGRMMSVQRRFATEGQKNRTTQHRCFKTKFNCRRVLY
jgi:hypothetical protein